MIGVDEFMNIKELHQEGHSIKAICRLSGLSRNTVRKVLRGQHTLKRQSVTRRSKLDPFKSYLEERYAQTQLSAVRLIEEIKPMGYEGSLATLRRFLRELKPQHTQQQKLTVRFETPPGKQAQVDWMYCGRFELPNGQYTAVYGFVMVLSYSRAQFVCFTRSMNLGELIACHQKAFDYFAGWPEVLLYDNMKQVKVSRQKWNEQFLDFAQHYGIIPKTHQPYRPRTKGKVERAVHYIRDNFLKGREFDSLEDLNAQALHWLDQVAHQRIHGTTQRKPADLLVEESLIPITSIAPYRYLQPVSRTVNYEAMVHFQGSRYSVPPEHAGKTVTVSSQAGQITISLADMVIAEHKAAIKPGQCIVHKEHLSELWKLTLQHTEPANASPWQISFQQNVTQMPLTAFEEWA